MEYMAPIQHIDRRRGTMIINVREGDTFDVGGIKCWEMDDGEVRVKAIEKEGYKSF
jgi:hypothetical protein